MSLAVIITLASFFISLIIAFIVIPPEESGILRFALGWLTIGIVLAGIAGSIARFFI